MPKISALTACTAPSANDRVILVANAGSNSQQVTVENLFNNSAVNVTSNVITGQSIIVTGNSTPANSTANAVQGQFWSDGTYLYFATANNNLKRLTLESF